MTKRRQSPATQRVLAVLRESSTPIWGLQIIKETGLPSGSVYPILARLESSGILRSEWESEPSRPGARRRIYIINSLEAEAPDGTTEPVLKSKDRHAFLPKRGKSGLAST